MKILNNDQFQENINIIRGLIASSFAPEDIDINFCSADGETIFHYAVRTNNLNLLSCLINKFPKPESIKIKTDGTASGQIVGFNTKNSQGFSPFELALLNNQLDIAKLLLIQENQNLITPDYQGTVLHLAITSRSYNIARQLISSTPEIMNAKDSYGNAPLHLAIMYNQPQIVKLLADRGANFGITNLYGQNARDLAILHGHKDILAIINAQVPQNARARYAATNQTSYTLKTQRAAPISSDIYDLDGHTPMHKAILNVQTEKVLKFIKANLYINNRSFTKAHGLTPLQLALIVDKTYIARLLVDAGADLNARSIYKKTAMHYATFHGHYEIVKYLFEKGADMNAKDLEGNTPFILALQGNKSSEVIRFLMDLKAGVRSTNKLHLTSLHYAVKHNTNNDFTIIDYLLNNGLDINAQDKRGNTPLHHALLENKTHLAKLLIERGADLAIKNLVGKTVRDLATEKNNTEVLAILDAKKLEYEKNRSSNAQTTEVTTYSATNQPHADHEKESTQSFAAREAEKRANSSRKRSRCDSED